MAIQTPTTPKPSVLDSRYAPPKRKVHIDNTDTIMGKRTSPAALKDAGRTNAIGQSKTAPKVCQQNIVVAMPAVSAVNLYSPKIAGMENSNSKLHPKTVK